MALFLSEVNTKVKDELAKRLESLNTNGKWATTRTPWIKATSFVAIAESKDYDTFKNSVENINKNYDRLPTLLKTIEDNAGFTEFQINNEFIKLENKSNKSIRNEFILYSGNKVNFTDSYNTTDSFNLRPLPIITSLRVNYKGEIGSTKRAVLKFRCFTPEQFESIHTLYMSIGKTVFVEWGWSLDSADGEVHPLDNTALTDKDKLKKIEKHRENNKFNYDGFQGRVVNFNFSIDNNLSYDCEIELMTLGDTILGLNNGMSGNSKIDNESDIIRGLNSILKQLRDGNEDPSLYKKFRVNGKRDAADAPGVGFGTGAHITFFGLLGAPTKEQLDAEEALAGDSETTEPFISWKCLLQTINHAFGAKNKEGDPTAMFDENLAVFIPWSEKLISCDPFVCVFANQVQSNIGFNINTYSCKKGLPHDIINSEENKKLIEKIGTRNGNTLHVGNHTSINILWFNLYYIRDTFLASESPLDFFTKLLSETSDCLGNICNLVIETDEDKPGYCSITDLNVVAKDKTDSVYKFYLVTPTDTNKTIPGRGLVRSVNVKSKLSDGLKTAALYSNTMLPLNSGNGSMYAAGKGLSIRTIDLANRGPLNIGGVETKETADYIAEKEKLDGESKKDKFRIAFARLARNRTDDTVNNAKTMLKEWLHKVDSDEGRADQKNVIFPLDLSLTIDGISGFKYGNAFKLGDYLPSIYTGDKVNFQIVELAHTISNTGWELMIEGFIRITP